MCWIAREQEGGHHGELNTAGGLAMSCNCYFYELGYRLSLNEDNEYDSSVGIERLNQYAAMYGFGEATGIEIPENVNIMYVSFSNYCIRTGYLQIEKYNAIFDGDELLKNKKMACMGDSITADDYCKIGTLTMELLDCYRVNNFAVGGATCADAVNGSSIDLVRTNSHDDDFGN
jgi:hypothetical protein